jgi:hypothetical protein
MLYQLSHIRVSQNVNRSSQRVKP